MGGLPSREAPGSIRTLRYGNHEIGLIPVTRQYFNKDHPELCRQFIRVRNDPNVRYCHMRAAGYCLDELPPAQYTQDDLDALVDTVEASLFDTNEDFLNAGAGPIESFSVTEMHRILRMEGIVDAYDPQLHLRTDAPPTSSAAPADAISTESDNNGGDRLTDVVSAHCLKEVSSADSAHPPASQGQPTNNNSAEGHNNVIAGADAAHPPVQSVQTTFRQLKAELQDLHEDGEAAKDTARSNSLPDLFQTVLYRRFKRAVRPLTCAVVFMYVNAREEHDCFLFHGHRVNVIGCFGLRTYEEESDDAIPILQVRKGIVKAAGDRTLERVLTLAAKSFVDAFTDVVLHELRRRPASVLLEGVGDEARGFLRELPPLPLANTSRSGSSSSSSTAPPAATTVSVAPRYDPVSVANALFFERMSKYPLLCMGLFNNYPTLKFIYDFSALAISVDELRGGCGEAMRLCTYQREKDERGLAFLFPGRLLAYTWLWSATQTQPPTVRDAWVQYTLNEYAQSRERRVQQWLGASPTAKTMLGSAAATNLFLEHLDNLHSEIVRARTTSTEDRASWATAQEYSYDTKLYRIFISPICGPLLTTVKPAKAEAGKAGGVARKSQPPPRPRSPPTSSPPVNAEGSDGKSAPAGTEGANAQLSAVPSHGTLHVMKAASAQAASVPEASSCTPPTAPPGVSAPAAPTTLTTATAAASSASASSTQLVQATTPAIIATAGGNAPPYPRLGKGTGGNGNGRDDRGVPSSSSSTANGSSSGGHHGAQPPSYSAPPRAAYPLPGMSSTYPSPPTLPQLYMHTMGGIAVPTLPSGAPMVVPQFISPPPPPPSPPMAAISPGISIVRPSSSQQQQQQQQQYSHQPPPPPPPPPASPSAPPAATYIIQIAGDGKQTIVPITLGPNAQLSGGGANAPSTSLPSSYYMSGLGGPQMMMMAPTFAAPGGFPGMAQTASQQQQQQQPLLQLSGGAGAGLYYAPATSYAPASFVAPLQAPQPLYSTTTTMSMPPTVHYPYYPPPPPPPPPTVASSDVRAHLPPQRPPQADSTANARVVNQPTPPYVDHRVAQGSGSATPASQTQHEDAAALLNWPKSASPSQVVGEVNASEDWEMLANALRLLD